jgi:CBS domain-containing protein
MTVTPVTTLVEAAKILETYRISSLPVVDGLRVVGMLSVTDLLRVFVAQNTEMAA